eukprot:TRINITY_DN3351_c1_g1_i3.p1 TRINITY_DN3351_c1_g1~~TRINITY_DN3351_c1_g1_i3.p1  ORF type:complete len:343 (+),score=49.98 TRINITY_DN3351_c1_g1_i3:57-1031(+)
MVTISGTPVSPYGMQPIGSRGRSQTAVMKKRKVSFYEGPRAAGPATSVLSSSVGPFPSSALKKSPASTVICDSEMSERFPRSSRSASNPTTDFPMINSQPVNDRKCGMLMKHAIGRSRIFKLKNWKQRWVIAQQNYLSYHKAESSDGESSCVLKIPFNADTYLVSSPDKKSYPFVSSSNGDVYFGISFLEGKKRYSLVFRCESELEKSDWLGFLVHRTNIHCEPRCEGPTREEAQSSDSGSSESGGGTIYYGDLPLRRVHSSPSGMPNRRQTAAGPTKYRLAAQQLPPLTKPAMSSPTINYIMDPTTPLETPLGRRSGGQSFCD